MSTEYVPKSEIFGILSKRGGGMVRKWEKEGKERNGEIKREKAKIKEGKREESACKNRGDLYSMYTG